MNFRKRGQVRSIVLSLLLLAHPLKGGVSARIAGGDAQTHRRLQETSCLATAARNSNATFSHEFGEFHCDANSLLNAIELLIEGVEGCEGRSAQEELSALVGAISDVERMCEVSAERWHRENDSPFSSILDGGRMRDEEFFDGGTDLNGMRQTDLEAGTGAFARNVLEDDASRIERIFEDEERGASKSGIAWPGYASQFESCELRAAMCCWTQDRQADDEGGSCEAPYDEDCRDADPDDNTDVCYVDMARSPLSNHVQGGFAIYGGDDHDGEGPTHCHGFAWPSDPLDVRSRYRGNNLFFVSMYDHLYQRGYVREIPGAPMCACVEQMPAVSRADCTQLDVDEKWELRIDESGKLDARIVEVDVDYSACQGANDDNDLSAHYEKLRDDGDATDKEFKELTSVLVGEGQCPRAIRNFLHSEGLRDAPFALVKTDYYVYAANATVEINVLATRKVKGNMEIGIIPAFAAFDSHNHDANNSTSEVSHQDMHYEILPLPVSNGTVNAEGLGEGSWRAVLFNRTDDGEAIILAKSEVFTVLGSGDEGGIGVVPSAAVKTDRYIYAQDSAVSIFVSTTHKIDGRMEIGILPADFLENIDANSSAFDVFFQDVRDGDVLSVPLSGVSTTGKTLGQGSWRAILSKRSDDQSLILAKSEVFVVLGSGDATGPGIAPSATVKTDRYIYPEESSVSIYVFNTHNVEGMAIGILPADFGYENHDDANSFSFDILFQDVRDGEVLSVPVLGVSAVDNTLGQGSWRAFLLKTDNGETAILARSEVFTILGPGNAPGLGVAPSANIETDRYIYAEGDMITIYVSNAHKDEGRMAIGILPAELDYENHDMNNFSQFDAFYDDVSDGDVMSLPVSYNLTNGEALGEGSWRVILLNRANDGATVILASSELFIVLGSGDAENPGIAPSAIIETDQYVYSKEAMINIHVSNTHKVEGYMEIGILPAGFSFENVDKNDLPFHEVFHEVSDGDTLSIHVSDGSGNGETLGESSWRAVLWKRTDDGETVILAKSEVFTILASGEAEFPEIAPAAVIETDQYVYAAEDVVSIYVSNTHKVNGPMEIGILPAEFSLENVEVDNLPLTEVFRGIRDDDVLSIPVLSYGPVNGQALGEGSWRAILLTRNKGETLLLAKSNVFTVMIANEAEDPGIAPAAIVKTDQYVYENESVVSIYVSNTHKVNGPMEIGILPAEFSFEDHDMNDLSIFEIFYEEVHDDDVLSLPVLDSSANAEALGEGSWRAVLLKQTDDGEIILAKSDVFTILDSVDTKDRDIAPPAMVRTDQYVYAEEAVVSIYVSAMTSTLNKGEGNMGIGILPAEFHFEDHDMNYESLFEMFYYDVHDGDVLSIPMMDNSANVESLGEGSWRAVLLLKKTDDEEAIILAKSDVFTIMDPKESAMVKIDHYVYAEEDEVSIYVSTMHEVDGYMEIGILPAEVSVEDHDMNDVSLFEIFYFNVHNGDVLSIPVLDGATNRGELGHGSWRAVLLLKQTDNEETVILAKSDAFTVLDPDDTRGPEIAPSTVKTDQYVYAEETMVSIFVSTMHEVHGHMEIGILPAEISFEDRVTSKLAFDFLFEDDVYDGATLYLPVSHDWANGEAIGEGSWRAFLLERIGGGETIILAKSDAFTILGPLPSSTPVPTQEPTPAPSPRPTAEPTPSKPDSYQVVCGRKGSCGKKKKDAPAEIKETHKIRCCANRPTSGFSKRPVAKCRNVFVTSRGCKSGTYSMAVEHCEKLGGRLCTSDEITNDCSRGSGCGFDRELVWTSTPSDGQVQKKGSKL